MQIGKPTRRRRCRRYQSIERQVVPKARPIGRRWLDGQDDPEQFHQIRFAGNKSHHRSLCRREPRRDQDPVICFNGVGEGGVEAFADFGVESQIRPVRMQGKSDLAQALAIRINLTKLRPFVGC